MQPGTRIGSYTVEREAGRGSFGVVYKAHHATLKKQTVALKIPTDPTFVDELHRCGQLQHHLKSPHIVEVRDINLGHAPPFLVMEWVEGRTLRQLMAEPLPVQRAVNVLDQVLAGLEVAHEAGVIHRDIKPSNVLITRDGNIKIADFGLGIAEDRARQSLMLSLSSAEASRVVGTVAYMAPEQREGGRVDGRADLYACGVMLFEMVMGRLPALNDAIQVQDANQDQKLNATFYALCASLKTRCNSARDARAQLREAFPGLIRKTTRLSRDDERRALNYEVIEMAIQIERLLTGVPGSSIRAKLDSAGLKGKARRQANRIFDIRNKCAHQHYSVGQGQIRGLRRRYQVVMNALDERSTPPSGVPKTRVRAGAPAHRAIHEGEDDEAVRAADAITDLITQEISRAPIPADGGPEAKPRRRWMTYGAAAAAIAAAYAVALLTTWALGRAKPESHTQAIPQPRTSGSTRAASGENPRSKPPETVESEPDPRALAAYQEAQARLEEIREHMELYPVGGCNEKIKMCEEFLAKYEQAGPRSVAEAKQRLRDSIRLRDKGRQEFSIVVSGYAPGCTDASHVGLTVEMVDIEKSAVVARKGPYWAYGDHPWWLAPIVLKWKHGYQLRFHVDEHSEAGGPPRPILRASANPGRFTGRVEAQEAWLYVRIFNYSTRYVK